MKRKLTPKQRVLPYSLKVYKGGSYWGYQHSIFKNGVSVASGLVTLGRLPLLTELVITLNDAARRLKGGR